MKRMCSHLARHALPGALLLLLALLFQSSARAQESAVVTATGMAQLAGGNAASVRDAALRDALRKAVETGLGTLVEGRTLVENFALVNDRILSRAQGFVSSYEVLEEGERDGAYVMTVRAEVNRQVLGDDARSLGLLQELVGKPRLMVLVDESWRAGDPPGAPEAVANPASAARLAERLLERGFLLVDAETARRVRAAESRRLDEVLDDGEAVRLLARRAAEEHGAEVLVLGVCVAEPVSAVGGRVTASATFSARMVDASTGALMGSTQATQNGVGISADQARAASAARAADGACEALVRQIMQYWQDKANNGREVVVKLHNVDSYVRQAMAFIDGLKRVPGVSGARKRTWEEEERRLEVDITYLGGDLDQLVAAIVATLGPDFPTLDLRQAKGNSLDFYLRK